MHSYLLVLFVTMTIMRNN